MDQVQHVAGTEEWRLVLQPVQKTDHGWYSCQVTTYIGAPENTGVSLKIGTPGNV